MTYPSFGGFEWGDMEDYMMPWMLPQQGNAGSRSDTGTSRGGFNPMAAMRPMAPYMNNPFGLNMQKCMDNDMCTSWVQRRMYFGGRPSQPQSGSGSTGVAPTPDTGSGSGSTDSGSVDSGSSSTDSGNEAPSSSSEGASSSDSGSSVNSGSNNSGTSRYSFTPAMFGFPAGFNPMNYGLDWDSRPKDCMDDSKCARGLMMYSGGQAVSQQPLNQNNGMATVNIDPRVMAFASQMFGFPSRLQQTRRLRNPRAYYGVPAYYGY